MADMMLGVFGLGDSPVLQTSSTAAGNMDLLGLMSTDRGDQKKQSDESSSGPKHMRSSQAFTKAGGLTGIKEEIGNVDDSSDLVSLDVVGELQESNEKSGKIN